jgi:hypothetical protein
MLPPFPLDGRGILGEGGFRADLIDPSVLHPFMMPSCKMGQKGREGKVRHQSRVDQRSEQREQREREHLLFSILSLIFRHLPTIDQNRNLL